MPSYIAKIKFTAEKSDVQKMERDLNTRFGRVASKFGAGLKRAAGMIRFGAMAGAIGGVLTTIMNPLQEINDALNSILKKGDNIQTKAGQYQTTAARYMKMQSVAQSFGVDSNSLDMMLDKFQSLLGAAKAGVKTGEKNVLSNYAGENDTVVAFYKAMKNLQAIQDKDKRADLTSQIFGQKSVGKLAEFLDSDVDARLKSIFSGTRNGQIDAAASKLADLEGQQALLTVRREIQDMLAKADKINKDMIVKQDEVERLKLERQNMNLSNYDSLMKLEKSVQQLKNLLTKGLNFLIPIITKSIEGWNMMEQAFRETKDLLENMGKKFMRAMDTLNNFLLKLQGHRN